MGLTSSRLVYTKLTSEHECDFHRLVTDAHVKAFLFDGETMALEWSRQAIADSVGLFRDRRVGIWLISTKESPAFFGFCGFRHFPRYGAEPEMLYAFLREFSGRGYATECALAMIAYARKVGFARVESAVDEPNLGSKKVLEKVGFQPIGAIPGAFGKIIRYEIVF